MKEHLLIVAGLLLANQVAAYDCEYSAIRRECEESNRALQESSIRELERQQQEAEYQRSRPLQVIGPEGIHTYYPSNDGRTWTNYGGIDTRR